MGVCVHVCGNRKLPQKLLVNIQGIANPLLLPKIMYRNIVVGLFPDTPSHLYSFGRRPGSTPMFIDPRLPLHEARSIWLQWGGGS